MTTALITTFLLNFIHFTIAIGFAANALYDGYRLSSINAVYFLPACALKKIPKSPDLKFFNSFLIVASVKAMMWFDIQI